MSTDGLFASSHFSATGAEGEEKSGPTRHPPHEDSSTSANPKRNRAANTWTVQARSAFNALDGPVTQRSLFARSNALDGCSRAHYWCERRHMKSFTPRCGNGRSATVDHAQIRPDPLSPQVWLGLTRSSCRPKTVATAAAPCWFPATTIIPRAVAARSRATPRPNRQSSLARPETRSPG